MKSFQKWTDCLEILPIQKQQEEEVTEGISTTGTEASASASASSSSTQPFELNILSFNVLAESYLTPKSHSNLPNPTYTNIIFHKEKRRHLLYTTLYKLGTIFDIICLQEVDCFLYPLIVKCLESLGFGYIYYPRGGNSNNDENVPIVSNDSLHLVIEKQKEKEKEKKEIMKKKSKSSKDIRDGCATFYKINKWTCQDYDIVQFDDLANDSRPPIRRIEQDENGIIHYTKENRYSSYGKKKPSTGTALPGITASYRRRNAALIVRLKPITTTGTSTTGTSTTSTSTTKNTHDDIIVGNAHLYWHPGYEYVKLSQAHYLLQRIKQFVNQGTNNNNSNNGDSDHAKVIVCGDMNSKPNSAVHQYFTKGFVDATTVAPWNYQYYNDDNDDYKSEEEQYCNEKMVKNDDILVDQDPIIDLDIDDNVVEVVNEKNNNSENESLQVQNITNSFLDMTLCKPCDDDKEEDNHNISQKNVDRTSRKLPSYNKVDDSNNDHDNNNISTPHRYLLDITLNKFTRWLRILGLDAELETEEEEKARTRKGQM